MLLTDIINSKKQVYKLIKGQRSNLNDDERIKYFLSNFDSEEFVRKDYLEIFKEISLPTASRDMKKNGIKMNFWKKIEDNRTTKYKIIPGQNNTSF